MFTYCENYPINRIDALGYSYDQIVANQVSITKILAIFSVWLVDNLKTGLVKVAGYVGKIVAPIAAKLLWWKPMIMAIVIAAAVAIVVGLIAIYFSKKTKIPNKLKSGKKVKTPKTHKGEFTKKKGGSYTHKKTGWEFEKSKDGHYNGDHWHARPKNGKTGDYYNIDLDGNILS